jgi:hypothetical protein
VYDISPAKFYVRGFQFIIKLSLLNPKLNIDLALSPFCFASYKKIVLKLCFFTGYFV